MNVLRSISQACKHGELSVTITKNNAAYQIRARQQRKLEGDIPLEHFADPKACLEGTTGPRRGPTVLTASQLPRERSL